MARTVFSLLLSAAVLSSGAFAAGAEGFPPPHRLPALKEWPDLMTLNDGSRVSSPADWEKRREEILELYRHYVYGTLPEDEISVSSAIKDTAWENTRKMTISVARGEISASFSVLITLPRGNAPEKGFPCYIEYGFLWGGAAPSPSPNCLAAAERGYAGITYIPTDVAGDNSLHLGMFYTLYPFEPTNAEFPGVLAIWGWGVSRIIDALEGGAGRQMNIDASCCIAAGVSRYGKSVLVAGAYDPRIRVTVPSCSGAGGAAVFRGDNHGKKYDLSSLGGPESWENESINEPLANLQGGEGYWFCKNFTLIPSQKCIPVEQYMLCALCAGENRHLIVVTGVMSEGWNNTEGQCLAWLASRQVWDLWGQRENSAMIVHLDGHAILPSDLEAILDHCDVKLFGADPAGTVSGLKNMGAEVFLICNRDRLDEAFGPFLAD
ncbi:MAG: hypothetical protein IKP22_10030 [Clostridia bacterium]|nr:hypothetical protein [Clostridia bacterium]